MKTLIIGEIINKSLSPGTLEILGKTQSLGLDTQVLTVGSEDSPTIGLSGIKQTYLKRSSNSLNLSKVATKITEIIKNEETTLILGSSTYLCRDLMSFISVDLNSSPVSNCIDFDIQDEKVSTVNSINGGESLYKTRVNSNHALLLIRPKAFDPVEMEFNTDYETVEIDNTDLDIFDIYIEEKSGPQLEDSKVVISAGRGMVDKENLEMVETLASKLNAAIGGTRAIVDAGWMPYSQQVGQTGKTVKPDVYIACGISGATQHQVGMKDSKFIIAINKDEEAPIFQLADLGIVGDTLTVIPKLNENI
jgi:electron transfer flavoprotein alpha subunit